MSTGIGGQWTPQEVSHLCLSAALRSSVTVPLCSPGFLYSNKAKIYSCERMVIQGFNV